MRFDVGVAGHSGYSGAEAIRILERHPQCRPVLLDHREPEDAASTHPRLPFTPEGVRAANLAAVLLAVTPEVALESVPWLLDAGVRVVDLSGAYRLRTPERYERWYGTPHSSPGLLATAIYGLPEFHRDAVANARFVSNPGCYPTAANLALAPLVSAGIPDLAAGIVCDAKSGVSGAGRKPSLKTSFCEVTGNFSAYAVLHHRHVPEILQISGLEEAQLSFTAQLIPISRGILETIYFRAIPQNLDRIESVYRDCYGNEPFVKLYPPGNFPDIHAVAHTNYCALGWQIDRATGRAVVVSAIDNLGKGAAGQAVQNLNLMLGLPETAGLL